MVLDRFLTRPNEPIDATELSRYIYRMGSDMFLPNMISGLRKKLSQVLPEAEPISHVYTTHDKHYYRLNADVEIVDPNTPKKQPDIVGHDTEDELLKKTSVDQANGSGIVDLEKFERFLLSLRRPTSRTPNLESSQTHPNLQGPSVVEEWSAPPLATIRPTSDVPEDFDLQLPDLSTARPPKSMDDEVFVRPDAWDEVVSVNEIPPTDLVSENLYKSSIGKYKRLSIEDTADLVTKIQNGKQKQAERNSSDASFIPGVESEHEKTIREGQEAKEKLCLHNLALVPFTIRKYFGTTNGEISSYPALHQLDLIQMGTMGLMIAAENYEPMKGSTFSSFAVQTIHRSIGHAMDHQTSNIRMPVHIRQPLRTYRKLQDELTQELGLHAEAEDIADALEKPVGPIRNILLLDNLNNAIADALGEEPLEAFDVNANPEEFENDPDNIPTNEIDPATEELLIDREQEDYHDANTSSIGRQEAIEEVLSGLKYRESEVIRMRFGLSDGRARTLEEVGDEFGVTKERIRQIEAKTLIKLRRSSSKERLRGFFED